MARKAKWEDEKKVNILDGPLSYNMEDSSLPGGNTNRSVWFMNGVLSLLTRCDVYFKLTDNSASTFQFEVLALANVDGRRFSATMRTPKISKGADMDKVQREVATLASGMGKILGVRIFNGSGAPIPEAALRIFEEPA